MSNNDLRCDKCGCQHHPVECPKDGDWIEEVILKGEDNWELASCTKTRIYFIAQAIRAGIEARLPQKNNPSKQEMAIDNDARIYRDGYNQYESEVRKALLGEG